MKIAIQGHPTRGKEIIQILEGLGGRNTFNYNGDFIRTAYFIGMDYSIYGFCTDSPKVGFKVYTIEEFEKEFPFKIGDKVIHKEFNDFFEVISFNPESSYPYKIKGVCEFNTKSHVLTKWQPKMKEERFVTLTLDKAREWYKKGGELKEIALQAFTEKELTKVDLPKTWKEFCANYPIQAGEAIVDEQTSQIRIYKGIVARGLTYDKNIYPSEKSAEAHLAMMQLEQLRNCWWNGWKPDWNDDEQTKYCIVRGQEFKIHMLYGTRRFLPFPTIEMAKEFLECFRDLIEKAEDLI